MSDIETSRDRNGTAVLRLRYFFDAGSGTCLWSGNAPAEACCGYAIDVDALPLGANTRAALRHLVAWYDTSIDWDDPGNPAGLWHSEERARFGRAAQDALDRLRRELPASRFELVDER